MALQRGAGTLPVRQVRRQAERRGAATVNDDLGRSPPAQPASPQSGCRCHRDLRAWMPLRSPDVASRRSNCGPRSCDVAAPRPIHAPMGFDLDARRLARALDRFDVRPRNPGRAPHRCDVAENFSNDSPPSGAVASARSIDAPVVSIDGLLQVRA